MSLIRNCLLAIFLMFSFLRVCIAEGSLSAAQIVSIFDQWVKTLSQDRQSAVESDYQFAESFYKKGQTDLNTYLKAMKCLNFKVSDFKGKLTQPQLENFHKMLGADSSFAYVYLEYLNQRLIKKLTRNIVDKVDSVIKKVDNPDFTPSKDACSSY